MSLRKVELSRVLLLKDLQKSESASEKKSGVLLSLLVASKNVILAHELLYEQYG